MDRYEALGFSHLNDRWMVRSNETKTLFDKETKTILDEVPQDKQDEIISAHEWFTSGKRRLIKPILLRLLQLILIALTLQGFLLIVFEFAGLLVTVWMLNKPFVYIFGPLLATIFFARLGETDAHYAQYRLVTRYKAKDYFGRTSPQNGFKQLAMPIPAGYVKQFTVITCSLFFAGFVTCNGTYLMRKSWLSDAQPRYSTSTASQELLDLMQKHKDRVISKSDDEVLLAIVTDLLKETYGLDYHPRYMPIQVVDAKTYEKLGYDMVFGHTDIKTNMIFVRSDKLLTLLDTIGHEIGHNMRANATRFYLIEDDPASVGDELTAYAGQYLWKKNLLKRYGSELRDLAKEQKESTSNKMREGASRLDQEFRGGALGNHSCANFQVIRLGRLKSYNVLEVMNFVRSRNDQEVAEYLAEQSKNYLDFLKHAEKPDKEEQAPIPGRLYKEVWIKKLTFGNYLIEARCDSPTMKLSSTVLPINYVIITENDKVIDACDLERGKVVRGVLHLFSDGVVTALLAKLSMRPHLSAKQDLKVFARDSNELSLMRMGASVMVEYKPEYTLVYTNGGADIVILSAPSIQGVIRFNEGKLVETVFPLEKDVQQSIQNFYIRAQTQFGQ